MRHWVSGSSSHNAAKIFMYSPLNLYPLFSTTYFLIFLSKISTRKKNVSMKLQWKIFTTYFLIILSKIFILKKMFQWNHREKDRHSNATSIRLWLHFRAIAAKDVGIEKKEGRKALKQWIFLSIVMLFWSVASRMRRWNADGSLRARDLHNIGRLEKRKE